MFPLPQVKPSKVTHVGGMLGTTCMYQRSSDTQLNSLLDTEMKTGPCPKELQSHREAEDREWSAWSHMRVRKATESLVQLSLGTPIWYNPCTGQEVGQGLVCRTGWETDPQGFPQGAAFLCSVRLWGEVVIRTCVCKACWYAG